MRQALYTTRTLFRFDKALARRVPASPAQPGDRGSRLDADRREPRSAAAAGKPPENIAPSLAGFGVRENRILVEPGPIDTLPTELSREFLAYHSLCPIRIDEDGTLIVAATRESRLDGAEDISFTFRKKFSIQHVARSDLEAAIERLTTRSNRSVELARIDADGIDGSLATDVRDLANQPPVIRYVNLLVRDAYDAAASDIHLEATRTGLSARFRVDGVLAPAPEPPSQLHHAVVSRIKLLAELDIAERRRPQDGRIRVRLESRELDLRVSTVPTMYGESVVLRLLDHGGRPVSLDALGMAPDVWTAMSELSSAPHGLVLVTGPTGSGKTTTLYAALARRNSAVEKIITVEDPIEYQLPGVTQLPVHRQAGVTFAAALRAILRQDPDVVMIGEMRDRETAEIALQAAMTGHLVFSTLHTNDAIGAVPRLVDLGIPEYLIAATLEGVLAQRLVRRICDDCRGAGCRGCRFTGFRGRVGVFELVRVNDGLRDAIAARAPRSTLATLALDAGLVPLRDDGRRKVDAGLTTLDEVIRVIQS